jgi:hypothetical protein
MKIIEVSSSSKPCCEHANLVEENYRLKDKFAKGLITC